MTKEVVLVLRDVREVCRVMILESMGDGDLGSSENVKTRSPRVHLNAFTSVKNGRNAYFSQAA